MDIWRELADEGVDKGLLEEMQAFGLPPGAGGGPGAGPRPPASYTTEKRSGRGRPPPSCADSTCCWPPQGHGQKRAGRESAAAFGRPSWDVSMYVNVDAASLWGRTP